MLTSRRIDFFRLPGDVLIGPVKSDTAQACRSDPPSEMEWPLRCQRSHNHAPMDFAEDLTMKIASIVSAVISSLAPMAFADDIGKPGAGVAAVDYHYGMQLDIQKVLHRTDNSDKTGVVPTVVVYQDADGDVHKVRFLEWGGKTSQQG